MGRYSVSYIYHHVFVLFIITSYILILIHRGIYANLKKNIKKSLIKYRDRTGKKSNLLYCVIKVKFTHSFSLIVRQ